ncbi:restriction endonuclease subunit S, partial [Eubacterium sp. LMAG:50]|uniref:restriction endonuclease subunit S n=1 Tax=Eubacterium sp. LMAG:50 TaxID=1969563 RepID=UPI0025BDAEED
VLNDICEFIVDCPHSTAPDEGKGYPIIRTPNVGRGRLILDGVQRVSKATYDKRNIRAVPQKDDIIFAREAPAGNAAIIRAGQEVCLGQRTVLIRPNKKKVCPQFLAYYILAPKQQYELLGTANGATVAHVNIPIIRNMPVNIPKIEIQERIAEILSSYDDLIENNKKQIKLLEEAAERLYREWFVNLHFPGCEEVKIVDGVPKGWLDGTVGDIALFKRGKTITKAQIHKGIVPVVAGGLEPAYYHNVANTVAPVITISGSGANAGFARLYNVDVFASDCSFVDSQTTPYLFWVYCFIKDSKAKLDSLQKGAAQPHVYAKDINALKIYIPTDDILDRFCKVVAPYFGKIKNLQRQNDLLLQARDRLLPRLMSGEVEV